MWVRLSPIMPCREPFYQLWGKSAYKVDMWSWVNPIPAVVYPIEAVMLYLPMVFFTLEALETCSKFFI